MSASSRTMTINDVTDQLGISRFRIYKMMKDGKIPHTKVSARKTFFNIDEVRSAIGGKKVRPVDDEDHPKHDFQDQEDEQVLAQCQNEALEASQEAATSVFLDYIQRARKKKNRPLLKRLVAALAEVQSELGDGDEE